MIGCDRRECKFKWFHLSCLKLAEFPNVENGTAQTVAKFNDC